MTAYYVRSGASGSANGTSWANAYTTLATALSGKAAGDIFYVSEDHSESSATAITLTFPGTNANPNLVYCVDHTGSVPPVSADRRATASIATTGNNSITQSGSVVIDGVTFTAGNSTGSPTLNFPNASGNFTKLLNCSLVIGSTGSSGRINNGAAGVNGVKLELVNTTVQFAATSQSIALFGEFVWSKTPLAVAGATLPTTLFLFNASRQGGIFCGGVDLSAVAGTLVDPTNSGGASIIFKNCKLNAAVTVAANQNVPGNNDIELLNSDSSGTNYRNERYRYAGTLTTEATIVRTGGASDGTTPVSHKIVTTANASLNIAFESFPLAIWNDTVGSSVTATVYGIWGGGSVPNNDDIWIEAEYLGSSGGPLGSFVSSGKANGLASNAALSSDASSWGGSTTAFKTSVTFTPQQKGLVYITVKAAKASSTFYIDPKIELS